MADKTERPDYRIVPRSQLKRIEEERKLAEEAPKAGKSKHKRTQATSGGSSEPDK